jgi:hypothetical protein
LPDELAPANLKGGRKLLYVVPLDKRLTVNLLWVQSRGKQGRPVLWVMEILQTIV